MIITEDFFDREDYERLCEECSLKMKFEKIDLMDEQENYIRLNNVRYGLPVDVYLDESNAHASYGHEVIMFFRNSYNDKMHVFVAMSVSNNPIILTDDKINIHNNDVKRIRRWVIKYRDWIIALAECRIRYQTFSDRIAKYHENKRQLNEMMEYDLPIYEMAKLYKSESGLSNDIWLDDDGLYKLGGHALRFKVCPNKKGEYDKNRTKSWIPFMIHNGEFIDGGEKLFNRNEIEGLRLFKDINKQLIKDLADGLIDFERFKSLFKKVKNIIGNKWIIDSDNKNDDVKNEYDVAARFKNGYTMVHLINDVGFNILTPNNKLLLSDWYAHIEYTIRRDNEGEFFICIRNDGRRYKLYTNGHLYPLSH